METSRCNSGSDRVETELTAETAILGSALVGETAAVIPPLVIEKETVIPPLVVVELQ